MSNVSLFENLGFDSNPFQYSNADREDRLAEYFIAPPYFDSVYGEPARPSSCIVFAPRGGGKSAQRRMIEIRSQETPILCLTYDRFEFTPSMRLKDVSLQYHLRQIIRIALIGILTQMQLKQEKPASFTNAEKKLLRSFVVTYFTDATTSDIRDAIESLRSFSEKIKSMWNEYLEFTNPLVNLIFRRYAIDPVSFARFKQEESRLDPSLKYQLRMIYELASKLGLKAIYILIDKVDETEYTGNDPDASFQLISPLIRDLELLDMKGYAFKSFLWDELKPFVSRYARPDRVPQHTMEWKPVSLKDMLAQRLGAFSEGRITTLRAIADPQTKGDLDDHVILFAQRSPRDVIRICQKILAEQMEIDAGARRLSNAAIERGVETFCNEITDEAIAKRVLREDWLKDLRKNHRADFTITYVSHDTLKVSTQAARARIQKWTQSGMVKKVGTIISPVTKQPNNLYALTDIRLAKLVFQESTVSQFLDDKVRVCPNCDIPIIRDWDLRRDHECHRCGQPFTAPFVPTGKKPRKAIPKKEDLERKGIKQLGLPLDTGEGL